jgi:hypothetical protein
VGLQSTAKGDPNTANYVTVSEALADTLITGPILSSREFDQDVSDQIGQDMSLISQRYGANADLGDWRNTGAIGGALNAVRSHSLVTITTTWATDAGAWAIANAIGEVSAAKMGLFLDYVVTADPSHSSTVQPAVSARVITSATSPATVAGTSSSKVILLIALLLVSLAIAIAITFLLDYLDDRLRNKEQVTYLLQLPVLGDLPRAPTPGRR